MESFTTERNSDIRIVDANPDGITLIKAINVKVLQMYSDVELPFYATSGSAGCDIRAYLTKENGYPENKVCIRSGGTVAIPTGLKFQLPEGYEMQIRPRSGLSLKTKLRVGNSPGTLDCDYTGEIMIILDNISSNQDAIIDQKDRIAQLIFDPVTIAKFNIVTELSKTERGNGGFGSSGKN
jgi:dUTP pyrophosphatase